MLGNRPYAAKNLSSNAASTRWWRGMTTRPTRLHPWESRKNITIFRFQPLILGGVNGFVYIIPYCRFYPLCVYYTWIHTNSIQICVYKHIFLTCVYYICIQKIWHNFFCANRIVFNKTIAMLRCVVSTSSMRWPGIALDRATDFWIFLAKEMHCKGLGFWKCLVKKTRLFSAKHACFCNTGSCKTHLGVWVLCRHTVSSMRIWWYRWG